MKIVAQVNGGNLTEVAVSAAPQVGVSLAAGAQMVKAEIIYGNEQTIEVLVPGAGGPRVEATRQNVAAEVQIPSSAQIVIGVLPRGVQDTLDNALFLVQEGRDFVFQTADWVSGIRGEIENYRNDVLTGVTQIDGIVETRVLDLGTSLETSLRQELETYVLTNYYTITGTEAAIAGALTSFGAQFSNDLQQVNSTLTQDYYTSAQVDEAITSATLTLVSELESPSGTIGQMAALLGSDYYTVAQTNEAISQASLDLLSQVTTTSGAQIVSNFAFDSAEWTSQAFGAPKDVPVVNSAITFKTEGSQRLLVGPLGSFSESIGVWTKQTLAAIPGNTYRVRVLARSVDSGTNQLRIRLNQLAADYSFLAAITQNAADSAIAASSGFEAYSFDISLPLGSTATFVRGGVFFDHTVTGLFTPIEILSIEVLDITPINTLKASIENDYYTKAQADMAIATATSVLEAEVDDLASIISTESAARTTETSALASQISSVSAEFGELAASVTSQASSIATINENMAATFSLRAVAGSAGAQLELIASSDPLGTASVARISADDILLNGSVTAPVLAAGAVTADKIAAGTITAGKLVTGQAVITESAQIADAVITSAKIANASIGSAKILDLAVDTIKIAGNAVTVFRGTAGSGNATTNWTTILSIWMNPSDGNLSLLALAGAEIGAQGTTSNDAFGNIRLLWRGNLVRQFTDVVRGSGGNISRSPVAFCEIMTAGWGWGEMAVQIRNSGSGNVSLNGSLVVGEFKR